MSSVESKREAPYLALSQKKNANPSDQTWVVPAVSAPCLWTVFVMVVWGLEALAYTGIISF